MCKSLPYWARCVLAATSLIVITPIPLSAQASGQRALTVHDLNHLRDVSDPQVSPDGRWVAYTVTRPDTTKDRGDADIWMTSWDGTQTLRLTTSKDNESMPRWSPAGRYLAFVSSRGDDREAAQLWLLDRAGGEAERITDFPGGIEDYAWSPEGRRLAVIASDPDPESRKDSMKTRKPIVIDRFQFKQDEVGYLGARRDHLYVVDVATRRSVLLTPGPYNELLPSWAPDGKSIAFVSKRRDEFDRDNNWDVYVTAADSGSAPRKVTTFEGPDADPDYVSRPVFSPDGRSIAYLQGGTPERIWYAVQRIAVVPAGGGVSRIVTGNLDRSASSPEWSRDGTAILFLLEDDRSTHLASVRLADGDLERLQAGPGFTSAFSVGGDGRIAVLTSTPDRPAEVFAIERGSGRRISHQNDSLLAQVRLASTEEIEFASADGTRIGGFVVKPPAFRTGTRYPTVLWIHGGPVYQFSNEFDFTWQALAAHGYVVVAANPRGSSGKGEKFQEAIHADWGNKDAQDVLSAVDHVVALGIADPDRLGVGGWSYGGMLTNYVIAQDTRFKAAVSGSSISNILAGYGTDQYVREYEIELGRPWENLEGWLRVSFPFLHADRIVTPTLFMCGDLDFNVPLLNSEQMYQALRSLGIETQLVIYPDQYHSITKPSYRMDRVERWVAWYDRFVKAERRAGGDALLRQR